MFNFINEIICQFQFQRKLDLALNELNHGTDIDVWAAKHSDVVSKINKKQVNGRTFIEIVLV